MADDGFFTRLGRKFDGGDESLKTGGRLGVGVGLAEGALVGAELGTTVLPGIGTVIGAVGGAAIDAAVFGIVGTLAGGVIKTATEERSYHTLEKTIDKAAPQGDHGEYALPTAPNTKREKTADVQRLLIEAGYGDMLTRHGEKNGGVDGKLGRDTLAAEAQYRKDHHLAANEAIFGGESVHGEPKAPVTPAHSQASKLREV